MTRALQPAILQSMAKLQFCESACIAICMTTGVRMLIGERTATELIARRACEEDACL
jgi:hypothetical protein